MNKKIFIMPIAICAMGLASCNNKGWPTKTLDEADGIAKKIYASTEMTAPTGELFKCGTECMSNKMHYKVGNVYMDDIEQFTGCVNADSGYSKITVQVEHKTNSGSSKEENVIYDVLRDGKDYQLSNIEYSGTSADCTPELYASGAKEKALDAYVNGYDDEETGARFSTPYYKIKHIFNDIKTYVDEKSKKFEEEKKNADKGEFSYVFQSKDDKSLQITIDKKLWGLKVSQIDSYKEPKPTKYEYKYSRFEVTIENNIFTQYKESVDSKGIAKIDSTEFNFEESGENTYSLNFNKPNQDNVDLSNYYIEERK